MDSYEVIGKQFNISKEELEKLEKRHRYINEKLILDLVNGVGVVAKDLNDSAKSKKKGFSRVWDNVSGKATKRQNQINENVIEGLEFTSEWLQDHDRHLTRIDLKIKDIADELYKTQDEILKFYGQFKEVDFRVEQLGNDIKILDEKIDNIKECVKELKADKLINREITKIGDLDLDIEIKIFIILDNLASGEFGLWIMLEKDSNKKDEELTYLKIKLRKELKIKREEYLDFRELSSKINNLEDLDKKAIKFIAGQYQSFKKEDSYEVIDLIALSATNTPDKVEHIIDSQSHIRTFMTYENYIDILTDELIGELS